MRRTFVMAVTVLALLAAIDAIVGLTLSLIGPGSPLAPLSTYFEYGRSVPGKIARWKADPSASGNLLDVAWIPAAVGRSTDRFGLEDPDPHPTVRSYGMSFVNRIMEKAGETRPDVLFDMHGGPGAPANFALTLLEADRANRNPGDVVVLGVLASAVPALGAMTNATWVFEQPAPFTYAIFRPDGTVVMPEVRSLDDYLELATDPDAADGWEVQMAREDAFHGWQTFGAPWLDVSPFARLVRRTIATRHVEAVKGRIVSGKEFPVLETLLTVVDRFVTMAREDGQIPVVMLIQTRAGSDLDLEGSVVPALRDRDISYFATAEIIDTTDIRSFLSDGHYTDARDRELADAFVRDLPSYLSPPTSDADGRRAQPTASR